MDANLILEFDNDLFHIKTGNAHTNLRRVQLIFDSERPRLESFSVCEG